MSDKQGRTHWYFQPLRTLYTIAGNRLETRPWGARTVAHIHRWRRIYVNVEAILLAVLFALVIRAYIIETYQIPSPSMRPILREHDRLFVNKFVYRFRLPKRGEVIVFNVPRNIPNYDPDKPVYIKRVVGLPGDTLEIRNRFLYVNGEKVINPPFFARAPYVNRVGIPQGDGSVNLKIFDEEKVPPGQVFVFGDNSPNSYDSRAWGGVPVGDIKGKAMFRFWPFSRIGFVE